MKTLSMKLMEYSLWILIGVTAICIGIFGCKYIYDFGYQIFDRQERSVEAKEMSISIAEGQSIDDVADALEQIGLIDSAFVFKIQGWLYGLKVQPGIYNINTKTSSLELFEQLNEGPVGRDVAG